MTPLFISSFNGHSEVVDKLLAKGANIECTYKVTYLKYLKLYYIASIFFILKITI